MESTTFVKIQLNSIAKKFKKYQYIYWFDENFRNHFIEVIPHTFQIDSTFVDAELDLIDEFYRTFEDESICFVTEEELSSISKIEELLTITAQSENWLSHEVESNVNPLCNFTYSEYNYALAA